MHGGCVAVTPEDNGRGQHIQDGVKLEKETGQDISGSPESARHSHEHTGELHSDPESLNEHLGVYIFLHASCSHFELRGGALGITYCPGSRAVALV